MLHSIYGSGFRRFKASLQIGSSMLRFAIYRFTLYSHPTPKPEICPFSVDLDYLFNIFTANNHIY